MNSDLSFVRGGRRKLAELENPNDPTCPTEVWTGETGELFTRCDGEIVAGPVQPSTIVRAAEAVAAGVAPTLEGSNLMALLIVALANREG